MSTRKPVISVSCTVCEMTTQKKVEAEYILTSAPMGPRNPSPLFPMPVALCGVCYKERLNFTDAIQRDPSIVATPVAEYKAPAANTTAVFATSVLAARECDVCKRKETAREVLLRTNPKDPSKIPRWSLTCSDKHACPDCTRAFLGGVDLSEAQPDHNNGNESE